MKYSLFFVYSLLFFTTTSPAFAQFNWVTENSYPADYYVEAEGVSDLQLFHVSFELLENFIDVKLTVNESANVVGGAYIADNNSRTDFLLEDLSAGVVIMEKSGRKVLTLRKGNFQAESGGTLNLIYLNNGITNGTKIFPIELFREGDKWKAAVIENGKKRVFTSLLMIGNKVLGQVVGIKEIIAK
jgi:hypothetical protein